MIEFSKFTLANGLRVIAHQDTSTPMVALNVLYDVGSKDESPDQTGFAHLFEHLMFSGSKHIPDFDTPTQMAGGDNNAFTNHDVTNFYNVLPAQNIEVAFWIESDRMLSVNVTPQTLDTQRKVVVEEFKEVCLNQPYGDLWHHLSGLAFKVHPYNWPTIGKTPKHIEDATMEDVQAFYKKHYVPSNAIIAVAGNISVEEVKALIEKWFGDIPAAPTPQRQLAEEPKQNEYRSKTVEADVPFDSIYMGFHMPHRMHDDYYIVDLLSDVLANGSSSRFYRRLTRDRELFSYIDCYITGSIEPGLLVVEGKPLEDISMEVAEAAIWEELRLLREELVEAHELQKVKNKLENSLEFSEASVLNKAVNLTFFELLGDPNRINTEQEIYDAVTVADIQQIAQEILIPQNCSTIYYKAVKKENLKEEILAVAEA